MDNEKLLQHMVNKHARELCDDMKVRILNKLIEVCEMKNHGEMVLKEELMVIRDGVEKARKKGKDKEIKAIVSVIDNLVGRFGQEKDFEKKVDKKIEIADKTGQGEKV